MREWFRFNRQFLSVEWFGKPEALALFMHILMCAGEDDGQFKTSLNLLCGTTGIGKQTIRTCLTRLKEMKLIETETCNQYTLITVCDYDGYCGKPIVEQETQPDEAAASQPSQEAKPKKTKEELAADTEKRKSKFYKELVPYVGTYGKGMVREFFDYWSEPNKSKSKMRYEQEKTWDLGRRLARWSNHDKEYKSNGTKEAEQRVGNASNLVDEVLSEGRNKGKVRTDRPGLPPCCDTSAPVGAIPK